MNPFRPFVASLVLSLLGAAPLLAAPVLKISEKGITVENGELKCSVDFPAPVNAAKAKAKISSKTVTDTGAVLKYDGEAQIEVSIAGGEIAFKPSGLPADTQTVTFSTRLSLPSVANGKWQFDGKSGVFPAEQGAATVHQENSSTFGATTPSGQGLVFTLPAKSFQQLQDLRQFQQKQFYWQAWLPFAAASKPFTIKVSETASPTTASATAPAPAAGAATAPKAEGAKPVDLIRQKYGQVGRAPEGKKTGTRILPYKDGKPAAFMLGFDDSSPTHLAKVLPELEKHKMVGNFYVNPGGTWWKQKTAEWATAARSPYVVLHNHTFLHNGTQSPEEFEQDLVKTSAAIYALTPHLKNPRLIVFRQPGGVPWKIGKEDTNTVVEKLHMANRPWLDGPPLTMKSQEEVVATVDNAIAKGQLGFVDFHGVGGDANVAPFEWFTALLDKLETRRDQLWITDAVSWAQYNEERKKSELKVLSSDASQVRLSMATTCDPVYYDLPLTLAVEVPAAWKECRITQGARSFKATAANGEIRFDATPGPEEIVIKPG